MFVGLDDGVSVLIQVSKFFFLIQGLFCQANSENVRPIRCFVSQLHPLHIYCMYFASVGLLSLHINIQNAEKCCSPFRDRPCLSLAVIKFYLPVSLLLILCMCVYVYNLMTSWSHEIVFRFKGAET